MTTQARHYIPLACLLLVASIAFYLTLPVTLPDGDSGEYILKALRGGIVHPPGYPLYYGLLRCLSTVAGVVPAIPLFASFSSVCSLIAAAIIYQLTIDLSKNLVGALVATGSVLFASWCWRSFVNIEPYGLHVVLVAGCLYCTHLALNASSSRALSRISVVLGVIFGLGFCHHHSLVFLLPAASFAVVWSGIRNNSFIRAAAFFAVGSLVGLAPLAVFLTVDTASIHNWGDWQDFGPRLLQHISRREYSSADFQRSHWSSYLNLSLYFYKNVVTQLSFVLAIPLVIGIGTGFFTGEKTRRTFFYLLGFSLFCSTFIFLGALNLPTDDANVMVFSRFFVMPVLLLAPFIAVGFQFVSEHIKNARILLPASVVILVFHMLYQLPESDRSSERFIERHVVNILSIVPDGAVILTKNVIDYQGLQYGVHVLGVNKNVLVLQPPMWNASWYRRKIVDILGYPPEWANYQLDAIIEDLVNRVPLFTTTMSYPALASYASTAMPLGPLFRLDHLQGKKSAEELYHINEVLFDTAALVPQDDELKHLTLWEWVAVRDYYDSWVFISKKLRAEGLAEIADMAQRRADKIKPPFLQDSH